MGWRIVIVSVLWLSYNGECRGCELSFIRIWYNEFIVERCIEFFFLLIFLKCLFIWMLFGW